MKGFLSKSVGVVLGATFFLAALATIAGYLETSTKWPKVAETLSSVISLELLNLAYRLLFLFAAALGFWWLNRRLEVHEGRLRKLEGEKDPYVQLQPGEIIHPSPDGVLWKWDAK